ncbi:GNAT family N-acetyltransferase [Paenibacillus sp. H1-7]|uniref:GNAT family N-acetyltransferase n=1 Tax=Paenibacillus sp. H1-7 TaxID=2282849 RepID=UPI001EF89332|nr:GNAT family N-acetyltransferase [Paenibacillus sp. H1-7]
MNPSVEVEVIELTAELLPQASLLLAGYMYPNSECTWTGDRLERCRGNLERLLTFRHVNFFMAKRGEECVGFIAVHWGFSTTTGKLILRIQDLYVVPEKRKQGIAARLIHTAADLAKQHDANRLELNTGTANVSARRLYEALGFERQPGKEIYMHFIR